VFLVVNSLLSFSRPKYPVNCLFYLSESCFNKIDYVINHETFDTEIDMDILTQLEKARELNQDDKPKAAIKILKPLYKSYPANLDVILEVSASFEVLEQWDNARGMLTKAIKLNPQDAELWIRLSNIYQNQEDLTSALQAIEKGLSYIQDDISLLIQKFHLLAYSGRVKEMRSMVDQTIQNYPEYKNDLLIERASIYESISYTPKPDEEQVKDFFGKSYAVIPLKQAIQDLTDAIDPAAVNWHLSLKRARVYKQLQDFDSAISDYDDALNALDEDAESYRDFIQEQRDACRDGGRSEHKKFANLMREGMVDINDAGELSQDDHIANNLLDAMATQLTDGNDIMSVLDSIDDDPDQLTAITIAQDILNNAREPCADFTATDKSLYDKSAQKFCAKVENKISDYGFQSQGDFEAKGLSQQLGKRILLRIFISDDKYISAAAFEIKPLKPSFLSWILLVLQGKWKTARILELQSETIYGGFIITNNTGELNPFSAGDSIDMLNLPLNTSLKDIVTAHKKRLLEANLEDIKLIPDIDELFASQERLRHAKNAYRANIGFVTDDELKQLLGNQYDKYADHIRKYLEQSSGAALAFS
jgi:tetratricopeptide (TPR) repeat protein